MSVSLPILTREEFDAIKSDPGELIWKLCDWYREMASADPSQQLPSLTTEQNVLLAFEAWDGQVCNGGIIQLIENGYGSFIFETPVADILRSWGLEQTASIITRAHLLYTKKKVALEREKTLQEFAQMYQEHPEFEPFDNEYYAVADSERAKVAQYITKHENLFAAIK